MAFSVLMSVYRRESPAHFTLAMESVLSQTVKPNQIVLVRDGPVPEPLQACIDGFVAREKMITYVPLAENLGLGGALNRGLQEAAYPLVARMDTDDICLPDRFQRQLDFLARHPEVSICGGQIEEFADTPAHPRAKRAVPLTHGEIARFLKTRNPLNHMTVMFRKPAVLASGGYRELPLMEDYYLWCRMYLNGAIFANLPDTLVYARTGENMYQRRGGFSYFRNGYILEKFKWKSGISSFLGFARLVAVRFAVQVLLPNSVRGWVLQTFCRKRVF